MKVSYVSVLLLLSLTACDLFEKSKNGFVPLEGEAAVQQAFTQAWNAQLAGNIGEAERLYKALVVSQPGNPLARFQLGQLYLDTLDDPYAAIPEFTAYLELSPHAEKADQARENIRLAKDRITRGLGSITAEGKENASALQQLTERISELEASLAAQAQSVQDAIAARDRALSDVASLQRKLNSVQRQLDALSGAGDAATGASSIETIVPALVEGTDLEGVEPFPRTEKDSGSSAPAAQRTYKVRRGDTLWKIAQKNYGDASRNRDIRDANKDKIGPNDELIEGTVLVLPY